MSDPGSAEAPKTPEPASDWKPYVSQVTPEHVSLFRKAQTEEAKEKGMTPESLTEEQEKEAVAKDMASAQRLREQLPDQLDQRVETRSADILGDYYKNRKEQSQQTPQTTAQPESRMQRLRTALSNLVSRGQPKP